MKSDATSFVSPQEMNTKVISSPTDVPSLISPNQSSDSTASLKSEIHVSITFKYIIKIATFRGKKIK